ncbi:MAG TPA: LPS export ABC transporter periplasmic protein LptC [Lysobacter sp.]
MNWRLVLGLALAAAALAVGVSLWRQRADDAAPQQAGRSDYTLRDFQLIALDAEGRESFTLRAPTLTRDPSAKTLDLATPLFTIPPREGSGGKPWEVRSKTAWVSAKGDEIRLRGDVEATSTDADGQPIRMDTQQLDVFPDARRATSNVAVSLRQPGLILNGHSMDAKLDARLVQLRNVKARYEKSP